MSFCARSCSGLEDLHAQRPIQGVPPDFTVMAGADLLGKDKYDILRRRRVGKTRGRKCAHGTFIKCFDNSDGVPRRMTIVFQYAVARGQRRYMKGVSNQ